MTDTEITAYGIPLALVTSCNCPGKIIFSSDENWPELVRNLQRARQKWEWLSRVLSREGADTRTLGIIYVEVVQVFLLYGLKTWVIKTRIGRFWGRFHHRVARRLTR